MTNAITLERNAFGQLVFIGDDVTDVAGMHAAKALGGSAFSVSAPLPGADAFFDSPAQVRAWLESLVPDSGRSLR